MAEPMKLAAEGVAATQFEIPGARGDFRIQILNEDAARGVVTSIVHIPAGGFIPAHSHKAGSEMHYVLSGDLIERGERLGPGAFLTQAAGVVHGPHESQGGAQVLTVQSWQSRDGAFDFHIAEEGAQPAGGGQQDKAQQDKAQQDVAARAPRGEAGETGAAIASEGLPGNDEGARPEGRKATEQSLGRGYG
ncbi:cupin domain-containing protein [Paracraurococcus lichenis]|uniref:Cupin domain-containing protein n=1 Tax=Paracraurococcus lichenis TaxID=3064888 RepID=A0ABT9E1V0_9PROT|nr:cupin domain-containing protein [Paracraurococcus sp. LOR1-02]MDO9710138.1 cupin domain-containing protein [Paracraurococcus sp. LOR1-02]